MMIDKSEQELREIVDNWAEAYFKGEIYGFGLSDEMGFATFFEQDMGYIEPTPEDSENLHELGFRADTHRAGKRVGRGFRVKAVFDNNPAIQGTRRRGYEILRPEDIPGLGKIKIAVFPRRYYEIKKQLEGYGLVEYKDFIYSSFFTAFYNFFIQNRLLLWETVICITSRCSLRCEQCNMFMPYYKDQSDLPYDLLIRDMDTLFSKVDYVQLYGILGGEPLLNKDLSAYLRRLANYSNRIAEIVIATNGSVIASDELLDVVKFLGNVRFEINNYAINDEYSNRLKKLLGKIKKYDVSYTLRNYEWSQYRRRNSISGIGELKDHYLRCNQPFIAFQDGRLYTCHLPWSSSKCGLSSDDSEDYTDFLHPHTTRLDIVKTGLGHIPRGYTSNCAMCNGCDPEYYERIPKAVQLDR